MPPKLLNFWNINTFARLRTIEHTGMLKKILKYIHNLTWTYSSWDKFYIVQFLDQIVLVLLLEGEVDEVPIGI